MPFVANPEAIAAFQTVIKQIEELKPTDRLEYYTGFSKLNNLMVALVNDYSRLLTSGDYANQITEEQWDIIFKTYYHIVLDNAKLSLWMAETIPSLPVEIEKEQEKKKSILDRMFK
jgi:hypothetical protein